MQSVNTQADRDAIHSVLTKLEADGNLTPDSVVETAKDPKSPLHKEFTWDLKAAALMTWRSQARALISQFHITVTVHRKEYRIQEFVEAPNKAEGEQGYIAFTRIKTNKELAKDFLQRELGIASSYVEKTRDYARALGLESRITRVVEDLASVRIEAEKRATPRKKALSASASRH
jgi:hypothetical protein